LLTEMEARAADTALRGGEKKKGGALDSKKKKNLQERNGSKEWSSARNHENYRERGRQTEEKIGESKEKIAKH